MIDLDKLAKQCHAVYSEEMRIESEEIDYFTINIVLAHFAKWYGTEVVLYGGQTATPLFFGFKQMRTLTNDLDFAVPEALMPKLIETERLEYHPKYKVFFGFFKGVLCVFSSGRIHDWDIPEEFFSDAVHFTVQDKITAICAPEYTIALKLRRAYFSDKKLFGKDAIDIINLLCAPLFRPELPALRLEKAAGLSYLYAGSKTVVLFEQIFKQINHVPENYRKRVTARLQEFQEYLRGVVG